MAKKKILSVVTTYYNAEKFVLQALESVTNQITNSPNFDFEYPFSIEYVIVDDCSLDNTHKIVDEFIKKFNKSKLHDITFKHITPSKNLGCGGARKYGIENSSGDYLMFLDADDYYINPDFIIRAIYALEKSNSDIVEYGVRMNTPDGHTSNATVPSPIELTDKEKIIVGMFKDNIIKFNVWSKIYKRKVVETKEYSDTREFEDVRTTPIWCYNADKILIMNSTEINYRAASGSIIRNDMINTRLGTITAIAELFPFFKDNRNILIAMYKRSMIDLEALLNGHSEENPGFTEMSKLNTLMLKYIYPNTYQDITYNPD